MTILYKVKDNKYNLQVNTIEELNNIINKDNVIEIRIEFTNYKTLPD
jgi:hypothetical protein